MNQTVEQLKREIRELDRKLVTLKPWSSEWLGLQADWNLKRHELEGVIGAAGLAEFDKSLPSFRASRRCPIISCPRDPPKERLGCGESDDVSEPVRMGNRCFYVTLNRRLNYIGISTLKGPTRFFAQGEEAIPFIAEYDRLGAEKFVTEHDGCGFW